MPEITPQQLDEFRTNQAILAALDKHMHFDTPLATFKSKPRKTRSDKKIPVVQVTPEQPPLTEPSPAPTVAV